MKLLHLGDIHLGKSLGEFDLIDDQRYILEQILRIIEKKEIDGVMIAGDVYDKSVPSEAATKLLDWFLSALAEKQVQTFMISGNHDSDERLNYGSSLFEKNSIYISAVFDGTLQERTVPDPYGEVNIWLLPFVKASQVRHFYPDDKIETYDDAVRAILAHADIDTSGRNVLIAHQFVAGAGSDPELGGSEGASVQSVGLVEKIGYDCFDAFDYVALGHIHSPQRVGRDTIRYSGSVLKYSRSEVMNNKSVPVITLGNKGDVQIELVPLHPMRDVRHLKGPMKKLLAKENVESTEDFIYATLTDEDMIDDVMQIFRTVYPNTLRIDYDNSHTREIGHVDLAEIGDRRTFRELISDFYQQMYGCEISEGEMKIMLQAAAEAGVDV
ncbi:MAG: exonuclease SbcCD subunit D [Lachnospiraceae bacterium]|nr:exonuclease SbcCD subunit D [Lachnospiraceae bacterium]